MAWQRVLSKVAGCQSANSSSFETLIRQHIFCVGSTLRNLQNRSQSTYAGGGIALRISNAISQTKAPWLKGIYKSDPKRVTQIYESHSPLHSNRSALSEYIRARVKVDRLEDSTFVKTLQAGVANSAGKEESLSSIPALKNVDQVVKDGIVGAANAAISNTVETGRSNKPFRSTIQGTALVALLFAVSRAHVEVARADEGEDLDDNEEGGWSVMDISTRFRDVQGVDEAKAELNKIVHYFQDPEHFKRLGGRFPKGVLLVGPPGTGKTMLARAVAREAGVPFFACSGSDFEEIRMRDLFAAASERSPCIVFIDEIDAIGGKRELYDQPHGINTLNQLMVELDGFHEQKEGVIVIAATNRPDSLDPALIRSGCFDRHIFIPYPNVEGRQRILECHMSKMVTDDDVDAMILARETPGFSGADLANMVNLAAINAATDGAEAVTMHDLEFAKDRITMGLERRSAVISDETRRMMAYRAGGYALVAMYTEGSRPINKATIIPRGAYIGMVTDLTEEVDATVTRKQILAKLDVYMGARVAEELILGEGEVTTASSWYLKQATLLAKNMVTEYVMSKQLGLATYSYDDKRESMSTEMRFLIEQGVKDLLEKAHSNAKSILIKHSKELHALAKAILKYGTLTGDQMKLILDQVK